MSSWTFIVVCATSITMVISIGTQAVSQVAPPRHAGVITGVVIDEAGQSVTGARVQAVARMKRWAGAYYEIPTGNVDESDDRGSFRLHSLPPGRYAVAVTMPPPKERLYDASGYLRTYSPGTTALADAQLTAVAAGQEQQVEVRVARVRFVTVNGMAASRDGSPAANYSVWLRGEPATIGYSGVQGGYMTTMVATARTAADGSFSLFRVPAGVYTLLVSNGETRRDRPFEVAEIPLEVSSVSVPRIQVTTARGASVSGRLTWAGIGSTPWPRHATTLGRIRAVGVGRDTDYGSIEADVFPDGTFQFRDVYGLRRIEAMTLPFNWVIQSVDAPKGILVGRSLDIKPGVDVTGVSVVITNRVATIDAIVTDEEDQPFLIGSLLLMPRDPTDLDPLRWGFRATQQNRGLNGISYYSMDRVLPGAYLAIAIDVEPYRLSADADLMERARAAATPVEVREGSLPLRLRVVRLRSRRSQSISRRKDHHGCRGRPGRSRWIGRTRTR